MRKIKDINEINTKTEEGKLLLAAMAIITTTIRTDKTPATVLKELQSLSEEMFNKQKP
jgi:hypothetical protein